MEENYTIHIQNRSLLFCKLIMTSTKSKKITAKLLSEVTDCDMHSLSVSIHVYMRNHHAHSVQWHIATAQGGTTCHGHWTPSEHVKSLQTLKPKQLKCNHHKTDMQSQHFQSEGNTCCIPILDIVKVLSDYSITSSQPAQQHNEQNTYTCITHNTMHACTHAHTMHARTHNAHTHASLHFFTATKYLLLCRFMLNLSPAHKQPTRGHTVITLHHHFNMSFN